MDQDGSAICWAYASATLIDAWRFSHGDKNYRLVTSPIFLAVDGGGRNENGAGWTHNVLDRQSQYEPALICDHYHVSKYVKSTDLFLPGTTAWEGYLSNGRAKLNEAEFSYCSDRINRSSTKDAVVNLRSLTFASLINDLLVKRCSKPAIRAQIPKPKRLRRNEINTSKEARITQELQRLFAKNKTNPQPVAISYCADVLFDATVRSIPKGANERRDCKSFHASAIVGSRPKVGGGCEYLVRNSAGPSCNPYKCSRGSKGKDCCERGQIWRSDEELVANTEELSWLE